MQVVYARQPFPDRFTRAIFLAGPTPRSPELSRCALLAASSLVLSTACQPSSPVAAPSEPEAQAVPAVVVEAETVELPLDHVRSLAVSGLVAHPPLAQFYSRPAADAGLPRLEPFEDRKAQLFAWRVLADAGAFVTVESLETQELEAQCLGEVGYSKLHDVFAAYRLQLNLRRDDLQLVVAQQTRIDYEDGSGLTIAAGVPIVHIGDRAWLRVYGIEHATPLLPQELSLSWTGGGLEGVELPEYQPPVGYPKLKLDGEYVERRAWASPYYLARGTQALAPGSHMLRWHFGGPCFVIDLVGPAVSDIGAGEMGHGGLGFGGIGYGGNPRFWTIPAGAASQWPDGSDAGTTRVDQRRLSSDVEASDTRICYALIDELRICHRREDATLDPESPTN